MPKPQKRTRASLAVETLEGRELLSAAPLPATPLTQQSFDSTAVGALPAGWSQWNSQGAFSAQAGAGNANTTGLDSNGSAAQVARAWLSAPQPANVQANVQIFANNAVPAQLLVRGSGLAGAAPSYYALSVTRGLNVQLLRVVNGRTTVLKTIRSATYLSNQWLQLSLEADGTSLSAYIERMDTGQYLNAHGQWQTTPAPALAVRDSAIRSGGLTGLNRPAGSTGTVAYDNFSVMGVSNNGTAPPVYAQEPFDGTRDGALPAGWQQWSNLGAFAVTGSAALSPPHGLAATGTAGEEDRAWQTTPAPANAQVSAAVWVDSLDPAGVFLRGSNVNTAAPSYYELTVARGLRVQLLRVVNGQAISLGSLSSAGYLSGKWVQVTLQASGSSLLGVVQRLDTNQYLAPNGTWQIAPVAALTATDTHLASAGLAGLDRGGKYSSTAAFDNFSVAALPATTRPSSPGSGIPLGSIPQHLPNIRIAELAYSGTPIDSFAQQLLKNYVDLVVANSNYLQAIDAASPNTPQFIYTNFSNIYQTELIDWNTWADAHHVSREAAFYHVTRPTAFSGASSESEPVNWFWGVFDGGGQVNYTDYTYAAHTWTHAVAYDGSGTSMYLAYPEQFREINVNLATAAANGWSAVLEYPTAVDAYGNPTAWAPLKTLTDSTAGLRRSGQITFDPPSNWVTASVNGSARMYYVRWRTVSDGRAPVANTILGRNYTNSRNGNAGTIPVFDYAADTNHDGYLDNQEYAVAVAHGDYARFAYESRLFYPAYGPMRPATNPSSSAFRAWAADYAVRQLKAQPLADGLFVDNSGGKAPTSDGVVREALDTYSQAYGALLGAVERAIPSHLVLANTSGGGTNTDPLLSQNVGSFEEFAIRPLAQNWQQFEDLAAQVAHRQALHVPPPYQVLDSLPTNGSPTDPRTQLATLAYYYLLADPKTTFLDFFGGYSPSSSWTQHWSPAAAYDIGQPQGSWSLFASGADPSDRALTYHVYQRHYTNALVLYRPLAHAQGKAGTGSLGSASAETFHLDGTYRLLNANGTLGRTVSSVTLRDGEGAILVKV